ncbi:GGDEF domain-containing protein [Hoeflea sp. YIM 152468]|uniref:GGDEF domain-containing protein n=1 Tax=Hoeflea sp. YIM 152468 TaxID=3031759 RepID=UPI0023DC7C78|nr:GGDEF domain-containing protein [Hoeflea sp. YIM 152468]MDF1608464.1 GGDEF domain-containing protein [Hoeflea sp. YIM 152468]
MSIENLFQISEMRQVYRLAAIITAFTVCVPVLSIGSVIWSLGGTGIALYLVWLGPALLIPLLITPPLSIAVLNMFRMQTLTIDKVDEYIRYDTLTGVLTRTYLLGKTKEVVPQTGVFLMIDADHFKAINDTHGHDIGDEALKRLAELLRKALPTDALIGRLGGEEFGIFLPGADESAIAEISDRLCLLMRTEGRFVSGRRIDLTVSIGGARHHPGQSLEKTMKLADTALYQAKRTGRDRYCVAGAPAGVVPAPPRPASLAS